METIPLSTIYEGLFDGPHATPQPSESGPIFLGIKNITEDGRLDFSSIRFISEDEYPKWTKRVTPQPGDIVFSYEATLHRYAIIPEGFRGCLGRRMALIRPDYSKVDKDYLFNYFFSSIWRNEVNKNVLSGATVDRIPLTQIPNFEITIHTLPEQKKIAEVLGNYSKLIENNNRRIAILEDMAQSLYREWFVNFRYPDDAYARDASSTNALIENQGKSKLIDSPLGQIPDGWEVKRLDEIAVVNPDSITKKNAPESIGYIDIKSIGSGIINEIKLVQFKDAPSRAKRIVVDGDIIWATVRPNRKQFSYICKPSSNTIASTGFAVIRSKKVPASYMYSFTTTDAFTSYLVNHATGSAYPAVNSDIFKKANVLVPPSELLEKFDELCLATMQQSEVLKKKNKNLKQQRDMLLPKLISGQIELKD